MNFGLMYRAGKIKNRLHLTNYYEGILVIFQLLSILLVRSCQKLTVKIGLGFFWLKLEFLWILEVPNMLFDFLEFGGEEKGRRDTWRIRRVPEGLLGWFAGLPGGTRVVCGSGQVSHSEIIRGNKLARGTWHTRRLPGGVRYSGQVALSESTRRVVVESPG